jgi:hypothetical protein
MAQRVKLNVAAKVKIILLSALKSNFTVYNNAGTFEQH